MGKLIGKISFIKKNKFFQQMILISKNETPTPIRNALNIGDTAAEKLQYLSLFCGNYQKSIFNAVTNSDVTVPNYVLVFLDTLYNELLYQPIASFDGKVSNMISLIYIITSK
jgi:hypothetical protein